MTLSIALITADPAQRVATILQPLRPYADEIIIAADSRVDETTLAGYRSLTERLFRIDFRWAERHLGWLCAQCRSDWIMRLDGDELPSAAFLGRLPELLKSRQVRQVWTRMAWVYPDGEHILGEPPWSENFTIRMMRNDGSARTRALQHFHFEPVVPREYLEEPYYHLDLLVSSTQIRRDKAIRYEVARPGMIAPGGGRINEAYYLPELRDSVKLRAVPREDRALIAAALRPSPAPTATPALRTLARDVLPTHVDRFWEGRDLDPDAYQAKIEPYESHCTMAPAERRQVFFRVRNEGSARWPAGLDEHPQIRLAYRWVRTDDSVHTGEGLRSAFPRAVDRGEELLVPVDVAAPPEGGDYLLEIDVVHEHVRWFDCPCRVMVSVWPSSELPPEGARLRETPPRSLAHGRTLLIPQRIHRVWLGSGEVPLESERFAATLSEHHPGWEMTLWTDADLHALGIGDGDRGRAGTAVGLSHLVRYEVLRRFGGVYVDADVECLRSLAPLLRGVEAFAALDGPGVVGTAVLGSIPGHRVFARAARLAREALGLGPNGTDANGAYFFSLIVEQEPGVTLFDSSVFRSYIRSERERQHDRLPDRFAVRHAAAASIAQVDRALPARSSD